MRAGSCELEFEAGRADFYEEPRMLVYLRFVHLVVNEGLVDRRMLPSPMGQGARCCESQVPHSAVTYLVLTAYSSCALLLHHSRVHPRPSPPNSTTAHSPALHAHKRASVSLLVTENRMTIVRVDGVISQSGGANSS